MVSSYYANLEFYEPGSIYEFRAAPDFFFSGYDEISSRGYDIFIFPTNVSLPIMLTCISVIEKPEKSPVIKFLYQARYIHAFEVSLRARGDVKKIIC